MVKSRKNAVLTRVAWFALLMVTIMAGLQVSSVPAEAGQAALSWSAPTTNTDGTPVSNLAGYNVYVGNASRSYQQKINVGNTTSYNVANLNDGATYYFAVTAYNSAGMESPYSTEGSKTFPAAPTAYTITATAAAGGSITPLNNSRVSTATSGSTTIKSVTVTGGASQGFSIAANSGYGIADVKVDGVSVGAVASYSFTNVTANHTIAASFVQNVASYTITATAGTGGSIAPAGASSVTSGGSKSYTVAAASGYRIADVKVNGISVGAVASYTFTNVTADQTIAASFAAATTTTPPTGGTVAFALSSGGSQYTDAAGVTYRADAYFSGGNAGTMGVPINNTTDDVLYQSERWGASSYNIPLANGNYNLTLKFAETYWSAAGKRVFDVVVGGSTMVSNLDIYARAGKNTAYDVVLPVSVTNGTLNIRFVNKVDNAKICAIKVTTASAPQSYSITASAGAGGTISPAGTASVVSGSSKSYSITPATGYSIADVKVDGVSVGAVASYSFTNVTSNRSISASFAVKKYTITASAGTGGSITPSGSATVSHGAGASYSIAAAAGYRIADVKVDGVSVGAVPSYSFTNVTSNRSIQASFAATVVPGKVVYAASSGGSQYTDASGVTYRADAYYSGGNAGTMGVAINNTTDDVLYQSERWGASSYSIPMANGNYNLTLKFAETYWSAAGKRVFDVVVGGTTMVSNLDIFARAGKNSAYDVVLPVTVTNGALNIRFVNKVDNAKICAIKVATR